MSDHVYGWEPQAIRDVLDAHDIRGIAVRVCGAYVGCTALFDERRHQDRRHT